MRASLLLMFAACSFEHGRLPPGTDFPPVDAPAGEADVMSAIDAPSGCPISYTASFGASRYRIGMASWYEAQLACAADGTHLVVIEDADENGFVLSLDGDGDIWIGLSDHLVEGQFRWVTGPALGTYQAWQLLQPNNAGGAEDCGEMNFGGGWNDNGCNVEQTYVCECDGAPPPTMATWCRTGTDAHCNVCGDACSDTEACNADQVCRSD